jgi:hypothetical protein
MVPPLAFSQSDGHEIQDFAKATVCEKTGDEYVRLGPVELLVGNPFNARLTSPLLKREWILSGCYAAV